MMSAATKATTSNGRRADYATKVFMALLERSNVPEPVREHRFDERRRWRLDFAWPEFKVALEVEGGAWTRGRHTRGAGFLADIEKYNAATAQGWRILRTTPSDLISADTIRTIQATIRLAR
jgi:very-short-patch-repair endonuclease